MRCRCRCALRRRRGGAHLCLLRRPAPASGGRARADVLGIPHGGRAFRRAARAISAPRAGFPAGRGAARLFKGAEAGRAVLVHAQQPHRKNHPPRASGIGPAAMQKAAHARAARRVLSRFYGRKKCARPSAAI